VAAREHLPGLERGDRQVTALCVGDGHWARMGVFVACATAWRAVSVDPVCKASVTPRLGDLAGRVTFVRAGVPDAGRFPVTGRAVLFLLHAHVEIEWCLDALAAACGAGGECEVAGVVQVPCCQWVRRERAVRGRGPDAEYVDAAIDTNANIVRVWQGRGLRVRGR